MKLLENIEKYRNYYNDSDFKIVLKSIGKRIGSHLVFYALIIYTLLRDEAVPAKVRIVLIGVLGYLILPSDLIADVLPIVGFSDDIAFLTYVVKMAEKYITPEVKQKARERMIDWTNLDIDDVEVSSDEDETQYNEYG